MAMVRTAEQREGTVKAIAGGDSIAEGGYLKDHADVKAMRPPVLKPVEEAYTMARPCRVPIPDLSQQGDLISGRLRVVRSALLHLWM